MVCSGLAYMIYKDCVQEEKGINEDTAVGESLRLFLYRLLQYYYRLPKNNTKIGRNNYNDTRKEDTGRDEFQTDNR